MFFNDDDLSIPSIIGEITNTSSLNEKIDLLRKYDTSLLRDVFNTAYNPFIKFWIKKIPDFYTNYGEGDYSLQEALNRLTALSSRTYTGNAAQEWLANILANSSIANAHVISKIVKKDMKCGVSAGLLNKAWGEGFIPDFPYMRCTLPKHADLENWDFTKGVFSQLKADGSFRFIDVDENGEVSFITRSGNPDPMEMYEDLVEEIKETGITGKQYHGELLVYDVNNKMLDRQTGNGILNSVSKGGDWFDDNGNEYYPVLQVWDVIPLEEAVPKNKYNKPYYDRFAQLSEIFSKSGKVSIIPTKMTYSLEEAYDHYFEMLELGYEGTVVKHRDAIWEDTTSKHQVKMKLEIPVDLKIVGFRKGNGKNEHLFGSIICQTSDGLLEVAATGFKDKKQKGILTREEIWEIKDSLIDTIMTVKSNGVMKPKGNKTTYSLFLPGFVEFRNDKTVADTLEQVIEQFANAIKNKGK